METKFTPWRAQRQFGKWVIGPNPEREGVLAIEIACRPTDTERESAANLIAAAPELYAVCESSLRFIEAVESRIGVSALGDQLRSALTKARGEA